MSEIEKLYENTGVKPRYWCSYQCIWCPIEDIGKFNPKCAKTKVTKDCDARSPIKQSPSFTTNKQLELVKLLSNKCDLTISHFTEWEFIHFDGQEPTEVKGKNFDETLAKLVNSYWENLTEKEQKQIKEILER